jgi:hypothetical protein
MRRVIVSESSLSILSSGMSGAPLNRLLSIRIGAHRGHVIKEGQPIMFSPFETNYPADSGDIQSIFQKFPILFREHDFHCYFMDRRNG